MATSKEMIESFEKVRPVNYGARFYRTDLHFHTPGSEDARESKKYNFNPYKAAFPKKKDNSPAYFQEVKKIQEEVLSKSRKIAQRMVERFMEERLGLVAITDHNGIGTIWNDPEAPKNMMDLAAPTWYELIDDEARRINEEAGKIVLTILPGVEISTTDIHILAIFPPMQPRRKVHFLICDLLNEMGFEVDEWGKNLEAGKVSVYNAIELITGKGGLPVIAHADAHDKALLKLYEIKGAAMKDILKNKNLLAMEIVKPESFSKTHKKVGQPLSRWIKNLREKEGLSSLAYFQGSDAHSLKDIAKRSTYVKMTEPSFTGLKIANNVPSSRVRLYHNLQNLEREGLYLYGIEMNNPYFKNCFIRFNRHLNCVVGKKESGKSIFFKLMSHTVNTDSSDINLKGTTKIFIENVVNSESSWFVIGIDNGNRYLYSLNKGEKSASQLDWSQLDELHIKPRFYAPDKVEPLISSAGNFHGFLEKRFGPVSEESLKTINEMFSIPGFLEEEKRQLFFVEAEGGIYNVLLDVNWNRGKVKKVEFSKLDNSLKRMILTCVIIISGKSGPLIIDAPEDHFNNEDIVHFLIPIMKRYKDFRQVILFSNHPVISINSDPENYILLSRKSPDKSTDVACGFSIDKKDQKDQLVNILEGDANAFRKRMIRYDFQF